MNKNSLNLIWDELLEEHINYEKEQIHVLTALYGLACDYVEEKSHLEIAKVLELMKSSTLILDDFLDKSAFRNGIPSIYHDKGGETAVLTADILKSTANLLLYQQLSKFPKDNAWKALCIFEEAYRTICMGQLEDEHLQKMALTEKFPSRADCIQNITHTSAVFIQLPLAMGGILTNKPSNVVKSYCRFGINIGLAYQIRDDVLDIIAPTNLTGKPENGDLRHRKKKIPLIILRDNCSKNDLEKLTYIYNTTNDILNDDDINWLIEKIDNYDVIELCKQEIEAYCNIAIDAIDKAYIPSSKIEQFGSIANLLTNFDGIN